MPVLRLFFEQINKCNHYYQVVALLVKCTNTFFFLLVQIQFVFVEGTAKCC